MAFPHRAMLATAERLGLAEPLTRRDEERRDRILANGAEYLLLHRPETVSHGAIARSFRLSPTTLGRVVANVPHMLRLVLEHHFMSLCALLGAVDPGAADRGAALRAAYFDATRGPLGGGFTPAHELFLRDRMLLEPDDAAQIASARAGLAQFLTPPGANPEQVMELLDMPSLRRDQIELLLGALLAATTSGIAESGHPSPPPAEPRPSPPQETAPPPPPPEGEEAPAEALHDTPAETRPIHAFADLLGDAEPDPSDDMARLSRLWMFPADTGPPQLRRGGSRRPGGRSTRRPP